MGGVSGHPVRPLYTDEDLAKLDGTLAGERFDKLALAVARHAGNADDLPSSLKDYPLAVK